LELPWSLLLASYPAPSPHSTDARFLKYENGHNCCKDEQTTTPQELLTFINMLLSNFFAHSGFSSQAQHPKSIKAYKQSLNELDVILHYRKHLMQAHPHLDDDLVLPDNEEGEEMTLDEWLKRYPEPHEPKQKSKEEDDVLRDMRNELDAHGRPFYSRSALSYGGNKTKRRR
jgi:hypothetical protein